MLSANGTIFTFEKEAVISSKPARGKKDLEEAQKFRDYFEHNEMITKCPSHRFLAMMRGAELGFLKLAVSPEEERAYYLLKKHCFKFILIKIRKSRLIFQKLNLKS
jgi:uncharacterized protein